jgi:magnesium and cobalt transporter
MLGGSPANSSHDLEREIQELVDQGEAEGVISHREGQMIDAVLELDETTAGQVMVPRTDMVTLPVTASVEETIQVIVTSGHSRIPVYAEDLDHIVGVMHAKDLLGFWGRCGEAVDLKAICRKPVFVPQSMALTQLLAAFERHRTHLAIVVDEYGGTAGVVTLENVLEEIVGDIEDEYDQAEELISEGPDGSLVVDGRLGVDELSERLAYELPDQLPEGRFETVGGFVTTYLGRVPKPGEEVVHGPVRLVVTGADERRVTQLQVFLGQTENAVNGG